MAELDLEAELVDVGVASEMTRGSFGHRIEEDSHPRDFE